MTAEIVTLLATHEARWTTHGWDRPYQVMHCIDGRCGWRLRQKALMSDDDCYEAHREHVATELAALIAKAKVEGVREYRDALAANESAENWFDRADFLHDLDDWANGIEASP